MPIYEYVCDDCQARFERIVLSPKSAEAIACPQCAGTRHTLQLSVFSRPGKSGGPGGSDASGGPSFGGGGGGGCTPTSCGCN